MMKYFLKEKNVKVLKIVLISIVALILLIAVLGYGYIKYLLPKVDGEIASEKIREGATVVRDEYGVPHIYADNN